MCGIVGYVGKEGLATKVIFESLGELRYRGYDSCGLATIYMKPDGKKQMNVLKSTGKIWQAREEFNNEFPDNKTSNIVIGHNRWATRGKISPENAHPLNDCKEQIYVVHNGIIDNYQQLMDRKNHKYESDTDTEVIPHLIEDYEKDGLGFENAFTKAVGDLEGQYAIAAIDAKEPDKIMAARQDSPLVIGLGNGEKFVSSDVISIDQYTNRFVRLLDGDTAKITKDNISVYNKGKKVRRKVNTITDLKEWDKCSVISHYNKDTSRWNSYITLDEIRNQPISMMRTLHQNPKYINKAVRKIGKAEKIILTGSGSSYNAALGGEFLFSDIGFNARAVQASALENYKKTFDDDTVILALSQSGETMDIIHSLKRIRKERNPHIISIINNPLSTLSEEVADINIPMNCGPEYGVNSTKTFTSQQIILRQLYYGLNGELKEGNKKIKNSIGDISKWLETSVFGYGDGGEVFLNFLRTDFVATIGDGISYSVANEAALKINELTRLPAKAYMSGEFKHGPLTTISKTGNPFEKNITVIAVAPHDETFNSTMRAVSEIESHGSQVICVSERNDGSFKKRNFLETADTEITELSSTIALQSLAGYAFHMRNSLYFKDDDRSPYDNPPGICKTCTVL